MRPAPSSKSTETPDAIFVFKGTIRKLKASNVSQAPAGERTAVVSVDDPVEAPPNLAAYTGHDITVELSGQRKVKTGEKLIFHATPWLYAENLAVRSLQEEADSGTTSRRATAGTGPHEREIRKRFATADVVISGKVIATRLPQTFPRNTRKAAREPATTRVSEHDPKWREAIIQVEQVHKGNLPKRQVVVRFASSTDVAWRGAPKFQPGQQGYFLLHKAAQGAGSTTQKSHATTNSALSPAYTVSHTQDFQPYTAKAIQSLVERSAGN